MSDFFDTGFRPMTAGAKAEWQGHTPQKFKSLGRVHFPPRDLLKTLEGMDSPVHGKKHFLPTFGQPIEERICLRTFPKIHNKGSDMSEPKSLLKLAYVPPGKKISAKLITNNTHTAGFFKTSSNKSLIRPASFVSIRATKEGGSLTNLNTKETLLKNGSTVSVKHVTRTQVNWKEKDRVRERMEDIQGVRELNEWETRHFSEPYNQYSSSSRQANKSSRPQVKW